MTRVHRLQHVECLRTPDFAEDDAVRAHAQRISDQRALGHLAFSLDVGRAGFQPNHMRLLKL